MTRIPDLVLFTAGFPFDGHESFLADELEVTAERFDRIFIVPSRRGTVRCDLPPNVVAVDLGWSDGWPRDAKLRALRSRAALAILGPTLGRTSNWRSYGSGIRSYLDIMATNLLKASSLRGWIGENGLHDAVFYDYWFENSTLAVASLRQAEVIRCAVARAHRFDVYDSSWERLGRVPFREFKAQHLDAVFAVSEDGVRYLRAKLGNQRGKVRLARLGVRAEASHPRGDAEPPLIVSCAALLPRKRVHLIPAVLQACDRPLRWVHFGDGPERGRVEAAAGSLPAAVRWELRGQVDNSAVRAFYRTHPVSAFLSLSTSEGIPVSMMEAQSCAIPIVALAVGGVPEIVTDDVGILLPPEAPVPAIAAALNGASSPLRFDPERIRSAFLDRFEASSNYGEFAEVLLSIWGSAAR